ncbi:MAG TPA: protein kinase [Roseiflexaceae bacterium]|nr:protein kinase [Roseiflexaceae bacterium]
MLQDRIEQGVKGYELREQIGEGGYGLVYRAYQPLVGRDVAVKIILPQYANHPEFIRRFEWEAQLVARLEHPFIVPLYDYWRDPDGAFLVMRWLRGGNLHDLLHNAPLPNQLLSRLIEQVGGALAAAHRRGVVHRDLKPANILLDEDGNAYLADFGIAKDLGTQASPYQTDASTVVGSPAYISPEQVRAEPITVQTDIYSLGVMLYEILTGQLPFQAPTPIALMFKHVNEPMPPVRASRPDLSDAVNAVIQKATAKRPSERYADVPSLIRALRQALALGPATTRRLTDALPDESERSGTSTSATSTRSSYDTGVLYLPTPLAELDERAIENPYKGLRAFQEADAADFFGRQQLTQLLLARLQESGPFARFLAVVGPSGSGKSSVVRAGLIPALRAGALPGSERWFVVEMFPSAHPVEELALSLLRIAVEPPNNLVEPLKLDERGLLRVVDQVVPGGDETEIVLLVDQFEELFTLVEDEAERSHFLNTLIAAVSDPYSRIRVVVTLRADFYDRPLLYGTFSELMRARTEVVVPLGEEELKQAIVSPAERYGLRVDGELVEAIVSDVGEQPGALPLLQYALTEVFARRSGRTLTLTPYVASGGVLGALGRRAEEIYGGLSAVEQEAARQLFLRLITLGEGVEDTRRRVRRTELLAVGADTHTLDTVIETYSQYRLLTLDHDPQTRAPTVEVAHEALIRTWTRLRQWLEASREDLRLQRRLSVAGSEWAASGHDRSFLAGGARLEQLESWAKETHLALNAEERAYLDASLAARDAQRAQEQARQAHEAQLEQRSRTFLRALLGVAMLAAVLGIGLSIFAFGQRREALANEQRANQNASNEAAAKALAQQNADTAATAAALAQQQSTLAQQQAELAKSSAAEAQNLALANGAQVALGQGNTDQALSLALAANQLANPVPQARFILSQAAYAPGTRRVLRGHTGGVTGVAFSPDGKTAVSGSRDDTLILWNLATGEQIHTFKGHTDDVKDIALSPDGKSVISASTDGTLILWDVASGQPIRQFKDDGVEFKGVAFSPDGKMVLSGSANTSVILWDVATAQPIRRFQGQTQEVNQLAFSPDGTMALSTSQDTELILWNVATGQPIRHFKGHGGEVTSVAFSPDGKTALSGAYDNKLILWDVASGEPLHTFTGHTSQVLDVAFSPDGKLAVSGSADGRLGLWDMKTFQSIRFFTGHSNWVKSVAFSRDGHQVLTGSFDNTIRLWDLDNGAQTDTFKGETGGKAALSADGQRLITSGPDSQVFLWDVASGEVQQTLLGHNGDVNAVAISPDGHHALSGTQLVQGEKQNDMILWNLDTGQFERSLKGHTDDINAIAFSPDGKRALSSSEDKMMILWDVASGTQIKTLTGHKSGVRSVAFSPDGTKALSGSSDNTVILWDLGSGEAIETLKGHGAKVVSVAFSPDGKTALSGSEDGKIIQWDLATGKALHRFVGHTGTVHSIAYSPDGTMALSGSSDNTIILWNIEDAQPIRIYTGHRASVGAVMFSQDGRGIISASADRTIRRWRIDSAEQLIDWATSNRYYPELTCEQEQLYKLPTTHC